MNNFTLRKPNTTSEQKKQRNILQEQIEIITNPPYKETDPHKASLQR